MVQVKVTCCFGDWILLYVFFLCELFPIMSTWYKSTTYIDVNVAYCMADFPWQVSGLCISIQLFSLLLPSPNLLPCYSIPWLRGKVIKYFGESMLFFVIYVLLSCIVVDLSGSFFWWTYSVRSSLLWMHHVGSRCSIATMLDLIVDAFVNCMLMFFFFGC